MKTYSPPASGRAADNSHNSGLQATRAPSGDPHQRSNADRSIHFAKDCAGNHENPGANNRTNDQEDEITKPQSADELGHGRKPVRIIAGFQVAFNDRAITTHH